MYLKKIHTYIHIRSKMADDVEEGIVIALDTIVNTTERSGNMKKELKQTIYETVSTLIKLFIKLVETNHSNTRHITELEEKVANTETELDQLKVRANKTLQRHLVSPHGNK